MELDVSFGESLVPENISAVEREERPKSRQSLDSDSAELIKQYFNTAALGLRLPQVNHDVLPILWVLDGNGVLWFAMEEVLSIQNRLLQYPLPRKFTMPEGHVKLGHPSLLENFEGRIGGEIRYDPDFGGHVWVISNKSGRYGFSPNRKRHHLENVAKLFERVGILLEVYYIAPGRG